MKILLQTPNELILRHSPQWIWLLAGIFVTAGILPTLFLGSASLSCQRSLPDQGQCQLQQTSLFRSQTKAFDLADLSAAQVQESVDSDGDRTYQLMLITRQQTLPFQGYFSSGVSSKSGMANRINQFIHTPSQSRLQETTDDRLWALFFPAVFGGVALAILLGFGQQFTYAFNRTLGTLTLTRRGLFGTKIDEHPLDKLTKIAVESSRDSDGDRTYRLALVYANGQRIPLTHYYSSGYQSKQQTANQIHGFLGLADIDTDSASQ